MPHWLLNSEPTDYSAADLRRDKSTVWSGVKNAAAVKNIRAMAKGDEVLIYHTGNEKACVAIAEVTKSPRDDPKDAKSAVVDVKFKSMLARPVTLAQIKADKVFESYDLIRIGRLSVVPTPDKMWKRLMFLSSQDRAK